MLKDDIKAQMLAAMKAGEKLEKEILRVALGEVQATESRENRELTDDEVGKILRKLVKSNEESLDVLQDEARKERLAAETVILKALLPQTLAGDELIAALEPVADAIKAAGNDGQATGVAMKHLKSSGAVVEGKDVAAAVKAMRG